MWDCCSCQTVLFSFLFLFFFFFNFAFCNTHNSGTVSERGHSGTSGPAQLILCSSLLNFGMADSRIFLAGGTLVGRVAEPGPPCAQTGHNAAAGGSQVRCAFFPFGQRKKTQLCLRICKACKAIFNFPLKRVFPKYSLFPPSNLCPIRLCVSEFHLILAHKKQGCSRCCRSCHCCGGRLLWQQLLLSGGSGTHIKT